MPSYAREPRAPRVSQKKNKQQQQASAKLVSPSLLDDGADNELQEATATDVSRNVAVELNAFAHLEFTKTDPTYASLLATITKYCASKHHIRRPSHWSGWGSPHYNEQHFMNARGRTLHAVEILDVHPTEVAFTNAGLGQHLNIQLHFAHVNMIIEVPRKAVYVPIGASTVRSIAEYYESANISLTEAGRHHYVTTCRRCDAAFVTIGDILKLFHARHIVGSVGADATAGILDENPADNARLLQLVRRSVSRDTSHVRMADSTILATLKGNGRRDGATEPVLVGAFNQRHSLTFDAFCGSFVAIGPAFRLALHGQSQQRHHRAGAAGGLELPDWRSEALLDLTNDLRTSLSDKALVRDLLRYYEFLEVPEHRLSESLVVVLETPKPIPEALLEMYYRTGSARYKTMHHLVTKHQPGEELIERPPATGGWEVLHCITKDFDPGMPWRYVQCLCVEQWGCDKGVAVTCPWRAPQPGEDYELDLLKQCFDHHVEMKARLAPRLARKANGKNNCLRDCDRRRMQLRGQPRYSPWYEDHMAMARAKREQQAALNARLRYGDMDDLPLSWDMDDDRDATSPTPQPVNDGLEWGPDHDGGMWQDRSFDAPANGADSDVGTADPAVLSANDGNCASGEDAVARPSGSESCSWDALGNDEEVAAAVAAAVRSGSASRAAASADSDDFDACEVSNE